ncbi:proline-rich receptor-like protein kinase PERK10 isoform X2 [Salmo salar]|uniref:Proline-rich receptor-like protein kinase PERK10 isoform X2 n=1 Tax=Salmo salar TaxID=8030 RepID=A0A1S3LGM7_SALSA|nr:proline-rich receptor-like protein kinase PERK10 isoform X2 [Salmo salar]|eukprot:XP_013989674.1 PREDICTED: proline-rich receptor-like protein kinase PERK10 isoform X2 [Salmo salar]
MISDLQDTTSPTESIKPNAVYSLSDWSMLQVLVWVTMSTQPGFPGAGGISKGRWVSVVLGEPQTMHRPVQPTAPSSPPPSPSAPVQHPGPAPPSPAPRSSSPVQLPVQRPRSSVPGPAPRVQRPRSSAPQPTERSSRVTPPPINRLKHKEGKTPRGRRGRRHLPLCLSSQHRNMDLIKPVGVEHVLHFASLPILP